MSSDRPLLGIFLMIVFVTTAPVIDVFAKLVPEAIPVTQAAAARFTLQSALLLPLAAVLGWLHLPKRREVAAHFARAAMILVATGAFFQALRFMPIADAIAVFFVSPLILTLLGSVLLGEEVGPRRIAACLVGFLGTLLIVKPSFALFGPVALLPLVTALLFALYMILTRRMAQAMHPVAMQGYTALAAALLVVPVLALADGSGIALLDPTWPDRWGWITLAGVGVAATVTHLVLSFALRLAPAASLAPLHYLEIAAATFFGWAVFGDLPDGLTVLGIAVIVGSGLFVILRERMQARPAARTIRARP